MSEFKITDIWKLSEGEHNGLPLIVRFRSELEWVKAEVTHPHQLKIVWDFFENSKNGLPKPDTDLDMRNFEDRLIPELEKDTQSILTVVITNDGRRNWYIYTNDIDEFNNRLHGIPQEKEPYPITIQLDRNCGWGFYDSILKNCG